MKSSIGGSELVRKVNRIVNMGSGRVIPMCLTKQTLQALSEVIFTSLLAGERIRFDFGILEVRETKARKGRNPITGESIQIPAKKKVVLKNSASLKKALNNPHAKMKA